MAEVKKESWLQRTSAKAAKFFREMKSELKKVVWPTKEQVIKNALIVAGCVIIVGLCIGLFDIFASLIVNGLIGLFH